MTAFLSDVWEFTCFLMIGFVAVTVALLVALGVLIVLAYLLGIEPGPALKERVEACNAKGGLYTEYGCQVLRK